MKANGKQLGLWCCRALHFPTSSLRSPANRLRLLSVVPVHWSHLVPPLISFPSLSSGIGSRLDLPRAFHDLTLWLQSLPKRQSAFVHSWIARLFFVVPRKSSPLTLRHILHFFGLGDGRFRRRTSFFFFLQLSFASLVKRTYFSELFFSRPSFCYRRYPPSSLFFPTVFVQFYCSRHMLKAVLRSCCYTLTVEDMLDPP